VFVVSDDGQVLWAGARPTEKELWDALEMATGRRMVLVGGQKLVVEHDQVNFWGR